MALKHFATILVEAGPPVVFDFDPSIAPFNVAIWVVVQNTNAARYTVQITLDDLELADGSPNPNVVWVDDPQFAAGLGTIMGMYSAPIRAARIMVTTLPAGNNPPATVLFQSRQGDVIH